MRAITALDYQGIKITTRNVSATTGLHNDIVTRGLAQLQSLGIISLSLDDGTRREYSVANRRMVNLVRKLESMEINKDNLEDV